MFDRLDRRTRKFRFIKETGEALTKHIGGNPTAPQKILIHRAAILALRLAQLDEQEGLTEHDMRMYACWQNHLRLMLRELGIKGQSEDTTPKQPDYSALDGVIADISRKKE